MSVIRSIIFSTAVIILFAFSISAQQDSSSYFEGTVKYEIRSGGEAVGNIIYKVSGDKFYAESHVPPEKNIIIYSDAFYILSPKEKLYTIEEIVFPDPDEVPQKEPALEYFYNTGNTREILGYKCEEWIIEESVTFYMIKDFGKFFFLLEDDTPENHYLYYNNYFPLMVVDESDPYGGSSELVPLEIIEDHNLPDSTFQVPAGYSIVVR